MEDNFRANPGDVVRYYDSVLDDMTEGLVLITADECGNYIVERGNLNLVHDEMILGLARKKTMKYEKHQDTTAQVREAIAKSEYIEDFVSAKFVEYEDGQEVHLVEGLNFNDPGEPNFKYLMLIDPASGEVCPGSPPMTDYEID